MVIFGDRQCKSDLGYVPIPREEDPRKVRSFPLSPVVDRGLIYPLVVGPKLKDNCYAEVYLGPDELHLVHNLYGNHISTQKGGRYYDNEDMKLNDTSQIFYEDPYDPCTHVQGKKTARARGRDEMFGKSEDSNSV